MGQLLREVTSHDGWPLRPGLMVLWCNGQANPRLLEPRPYGRRMKYVNYAASGIVAS